MSYDLEILVEGRKHLLPAVIGNIRIEVNSARQRARYYGNFDTMALRRGAWCSLFEADPERRFFSAMDIADIGGRENALFPFWTDHRSGLYPLRIEPAYSAAFREVMHHLMMQSPQRRIMFLPRLQAIERDMVCGVLTLDEFFEKLCQERILFNIAYIIQGFTREESE